MKKFLLGSVFTLLFNYCIGSTYIIMKGSDKRVRNNSNNVSSTN
nr:MAG TPA: PapR protein [Inoviridae sp.]